MSSLSQFLEEQEVEQGLPQRYQKYLKEDTNEEDEEDTESTCSETVASLVQRASLDSSTASTLPWYKSFEANDAFSPLENAILLKLSKELNGLRQSGVVSMVEESTIATMEAKRRVSQSIKRLSIQEEEKERGITALSKPPCLVGSFMDTHLVFIAPVFHKISRDIDFCQLWAESWTRSLGKSLEKLFGL